MAVAPKICLNMIVRNEEFALSRCLQSVKGLIDRWCIVDTGSTDHTKEIIEEELGHLPGGIRDAEFEDFAQARNVALDYARDEARPDEYFLFIDASAFLYAPDGFQWPNLEAEAYDLRLRRGNRSFRLISLLRADSSAVYHHTSHAVLVGAGVPRHLKDVEIQCTSDGSRRRSADPKSKYRRDISNFYRELSGDPNNGRATFYLAQSARDAGDTELALLWYRRRSQMTEGFAEERFEAHLQVATILRAQGASVQSVEDELLAAFALRPHRAEPLVALARGCCERRDYARAFLYANTARDMPYPEDDMLFVDDAVYEWRALDEYAIAAYHIGRKEDARDANVKLLTSRAMPDEDRTRILVNLEWCLPQHDPPPAVVVDEDLRDEAMALHAEMASLRERYTSSVSTDEMALSLESGALAVALSRRIEGGKVLDLGSGFSSACLRAFGSGSITSVDTETTWLDKTRRFIEDEKIGANGQFETDLEFFSRDTDPTYDLVVLDLDHTPTRPRFLRVSWAALRPGGYMIVDDTNQIPYRGAVMRWLATVEHTRLDVEDLTRDHLGRYAWLLRKPESQNERIAS